MELKFWKYEGVGNDFILIDGRGKSIEIAAESISTLCDRHRGIGADGLMILEESAGHDFAMRYHNSDGGEVNMCGNGGRCISLFAHHLGIGSDTLLFSGKDGEHHARIITDEGESAIVELSMVDVESFEYKDKAFILNTGVPHYVEFVDDVDEVDVIGRGREIRYNEKFKASGGINVNFVEVLQYGQLKVRTYERGVEDETLACGTGATASAIAAHLYAQGDCTAFTVNVPGGRLDVKFDSADGHSFTNIRLTGPARRVFYGEIKKQS